MFICKQNNKLTITSSEAVSVFKHFKFIFYLNQLYKNNVKVGKRGPSFNIEAKLLFEVTTKWYLSHKIWYKVTYRFLLIVQCKSTKNIKMFINKIKTLKTCEQLKQQLYLIVAGFFFSVYMYITTFFSPVHFSLKIFCTDTQLHL